MKKKLWLCLPPFALCMLDQGITLFRQSDAYWDGSYEHAREANPLFSWLLKQHPLAFEAGIFVWVSIFASIILFTPRRVAMTVSIAVLLGHTWGAATWLTWTVPQGYWLSIALFLASSILIVTVWEKNMNASAPNPDPPHSPATPGQPGEGQE